MSDPRFLATYFKLDEYYKEEFIQCYWIAFGDPTFFRHSPLDGEISAEIILAFCLARVNIYE